MTEGPETPRVGTAVSEAGEQTLLLLLVILSRFGGNARQSCTNGILYLFGRAVQRTSISQANAQPKRCIGSEEESPIRGQLHFIHGAVSTKIPPSLLRRRARPHHTESKIQRGHPARKSRCSPGRPARIPFGPARQRRGTSVVLAAARARGPGGPGGPEGASAAVDIFGHPLGGRYVTLEIPFVDRPPIYTPVNGSEKDLFIHSIRIHEYTCRGTVYYLYLYGEILGQYSGISLFDPSSCQKPTKAWCTRSRSWEKSHVLCDSASTEGSLPRIHRLAPRTQKYCIPRGPRDERVPGETCPPNREHLGTPRQIDILEDEAGEGRIQRDSESFWRLSLPVFHHERVRAEDEEEEEAGAGRQHSGAGEARHGGAAARGPAARGV